MSNYRDSTSIFFCRFQDFGFVSLQIKNVYGFFFNFFNVYGFSDLCVFCGFFLKQLVGGSKGMHQWSEGFASSKTHGTGVHTSPQCGWSQ